MKDIITRKRTYLFKSAVLGLIIAVAFMMAGCSARSAYNTAVKQDTGPLGSPGYEESSTSSKSGSSYDAQVVPQKLSHQWTFEVEVEDSRQANSAIITQAEQLHGYLVKSHLSVQDDEVRANLVIKVPEAKAQSMVDFIEKTGYVKEQSKSSQDVSDAYYDTEARLKVLAAEEERLLNYLQKTSTIQDMLAVEKELTRVRQERESLQARMNILENQVDYTTFTITIKENQMALRAPSGTMGKAGQGFVSSLGVLISCLNGLFIALVTLLPFLIILGALFYLFWRWNKRRKTKKDNKTEDQGPPIYAPGYKPEGDNNNEES